MKIHIPDISRQILNKDTLNLFINNYSKIGPQWTIAQMEWLNIIYKTFKDHDKFVILIYLIKKTLDFYSINFIKLDYDNYYSRSSIEIEKFNINDVSKNLEIPKETTRRKIQELEKNGIIKRYKKKITIDTSAFVFVKPIKTLKRISSFLSLFSNELSNEKILKKSISSTDLEKTIKINFTYLWKLFYEMQIPMLTNYKKYFKDLESFHIYGTCAVNQHINKQQQNQNKMGRSEFIRSLYTTDKMSGLNAMSISDITGIPRATVVRKLKGLVKQKNLSIDDKKHYRLTGNSVNKLIELQKGVIDKLSIFATRVFNLTINY